MTREIISEDEHNNLFILLIEIGAINPPYNFKDTMQSGY
jgi:hypothetical protein